MDATRRERRRRRLRALLALSLSTAVSLAGGELFCRAEYGVPIREKLPILSVEAHPTRGYAMVPSSEHFTYERPVRVNALGLRGAEVPEEKRGEARVLCLGDSTTYGQGLAESETLPARLELELAAAPPSPRAVRVVNGGLRGYGTEQEIALLEELGPRIRPDVVVLLWYPNDLERQDVAAIYERLASRGRVEYDTEGRLEGAALWTWQAREYVRRSALVMQVHDVWMSLTARRMTEEEIDRGFERLDASLGVYALAAERLGARALVAAIPTAGMVAAGEAGRAIPRRVGDLAERRGLAFVDLTPTLQEVVAATGRLPLLPYDWHYTGAANQALARCLCQALRERFPGSL